MARLQVAGRLRQVPEVVDFERAATFTKPEKRGLEGPGRRLKAAAIVLKPDSPPPAEGAGNLKPRLRATNFRFVNSVTQANHFFVKRCAIIFVKT